jgi:hypothetical protein
VGGKLRGSQKTLGLWDCDPIPIPILQAEVQCDMLPYFPQRYLAVWVYLTDINESDKQLRPKGIKETNERMREGDTERERERGRDRDSSTYAKTKFQGCGWPRKLG